MFVCYGLPHRADPREDLDLASWGVVKVLEEGSGETYGDVPWEPKAAFGALAECSPQRFIRHPGHLPAVPELHRLARVAGSIRAGPFV